jgi:hypothetical protein
MYLSGSNKIDKSMNGLLKISASEIDAEIARITTINEVQSINGKIGENLIIDVDTGKIIEFKDDVTMDSSLNVSTINNLSLINGPIGQDLIIDVDTNRVVKFKDNVVMDASLSVGTINKVSRINGSIGGSDLIIDAGSLSQIVEFKNDVHMKNSLIVNSYLDVSDNAYFNSDINVLKNAQIDGSLNILRNLDVSGNIIIGKSTTTQSSSVDLYGTFYIRDPSDPTQVYMRINYEPSLYGFCFTDESGGGRIMNFRVKNPSGGYKLFYFSSSQLYAGMLTYVDNWLAVSYNNLIVLGDANSAGAWLGCSQSFIPNNAVTSGHVTYVKGLQNNNTYYSNWVHVNTSNVDVPTFRINYANIWSKVQHTMESNLILSSSGVTFNDATIQTTAFTSAKNTKLVAIGGVQTATLNATNQLTTNTIYNCGSISLTAGTYIIQVNCAVDIITGSTVMNNMIGAWSTSATSFSQFLNTGRLDGGGFTYPAGCTWSLNSTDTIVVSTTTTYYMLVRVTFGTATRVRFVNPSSQFKATRIA